MFFFLFAFSSGFSRGGLITHNLSSLPGLAFLRSFFCNQLAYRTCVLFCNQLAYGRLVIKRAVELANPRSVDLFVIIGTK